MDTRQSNTMTAVIVSAIAMTNTSFQGGNEDVRSFATLVTSSDEICAMHDMKESGRDDMDGGVKHPWSVLLCQTE
jgi:hypothetical protein